MDLPEFLDPEQWADFVAYRETEATRKKFGPIAQKRMLAKLERLHADGYDIVELLDRTIQSAWLDVYPRDECRRQKRPGYHKNQAQNPPPAPALAANREKGAAALKIVKSALNGNKL